MRKCQSISREEVNTVVNFWPCEATSLKIVPFCFVSYHISPVTVHDSYCRVQVRYIGLNSVDYHCYIALSLQFFQKRVLGKSLNNVIQDGTREKPRPESYSGRYSSTFPSPRPFSKESSDVCLLEQWSAISILRTMYSLSILTQSILYMFQRSGKVVRTIWGGSNSGKVSLEGNEVAVAYETSHFEEF